MFSQKRQKRNFFQKETIRVHTAATHRIIITFCLLYVSVTTILAFKHLKKYSPRLLFVSLNLKNGNVILRFGSDNKHQQ